MYFATVLCRTLTFALITASFAISAWAEKDIYNVNVVFNESSLRAPDGSITLPKQGQAWINKNLLVDQQSGAKVADLRGFCVTLDTTGLEAECQLTLVFAAGTVQIAGLNYFPPAAFNEITNGLLPITGGTGQYAGASGHYQIYTPTPSFEAKVGSVTAATPAPAPAPSIDDSSTGPGAVLNGAIIEITYGSSNDNS